MKLFMILIGCKPKSRRTEQHDIFFGIGDELKDFVDPIRDFWPEADGKIHIDAYRIVHKVGEYEINIVERSDEQTNDSELKLFFVNLGGYKPNEFDEFHYKEIIVASSLAKATEKAKRTVFWKHHSSAHIDDKYGLDVDDIYEIEDLLIPADKDKYCIQIRPNVDREEDIISNGYFKLSAL
ncbi:MULTISPECIES: DUF1543 domain-containing protein [unclassified Sphingobacterium]|uniref:DUF1543 domain-containing protein n=1 Tax=unclassified Sphingobacterium TaxID=2609468 RepID=UPI0025DE425E|nr:MULTISPECIES: DUF1543 domain-containing protein [unclassified Sphingobacterium]